MFKKNSSDSFTLSGFIGAIMFSLTIAALGYSIQFIIFDDFFKSRDVAFNHIFRLCRMVVGYILPSIWFLRHTEQDLKILGFDMDHSWKVQTISFLLGICIYLVPSYVFAHYFIFTESWTNRGWIESIFLLSLIGAMAAITDLWTRGFLLLQVESHYNAIFAIAVQNLVWFGIHIYEIVLLLPYIGLVGAVGLTLFLGICGDLLVLKTRNVIGLMVGHVVLNLAIVLQGKGVLGL